jgi:hypothetical protein
MMNDGHANGAVRVVVTIVMMMERFSQQGKEQETDEDE